MIVLPTVLADIASVLSARTVVCAGVKRMKLRRTFRELVGEAKEHFERRIFEAQSAMISGN